MVRFSCFNGHININKTKKTGHSFVEAVNMLQGSSRSQAPEKSLDAKTFLTVSQGGDATDGHYNEDLSCTERDWRSDEVESKLGVDDEAAIHQNGHLKKSKSESGLHMRGKVSGDEDTDDDDDETDKGFSFDNSIDNSRSMLPDGGNDPGLSPSSKYQKDKSIFSIEEPQNSDKGVPENSDADPSSGGHADNSGDQTPRTPPSIARSNSLPNIVTLVLASEENSVKHLTRHWRSSDDLHILDKRQSQIAIHELKLHTTPEEGRDYTEHQFGDRFEDPADYDNDNFNYESSAREWIVPVMGEHPLDSHEEESAAHRWSEVPSKDFKIKRIEDWVFDLEPCSPLEETNELSELSDQKKRESTAVNGSSTLKVNPGMEAAKRYISSLNPTATTAQLSNHGLAVIPFFSAFVSLKVLNLSGNAIVRITAGALPRGLHALNLSKNHISVIEGLRELTRLRVLDLSYNRIFRIGHGLASCSSLKELYLAGNKISEVEGLHRLLKLNILDLRFNKISTAKCLGQLAANYNSLQAISLEGNPAQKNVGDEQLKKYLQGLLPQLAYYNRQFIKVRAKDGGERSVRLAIGGSHQFDRGNRSDYKSTRKSSHGISSKVASASSHGRRSQAVDSPRRSKTKHVRLPPSTAGTKAAGHHHHHHHGEKLRTLMPESIRRSRSMGTLGTP